MCDLCVDIGNYSEDLGPGPRGNDLGDIRVVKKFLSRDNQPGNCHSVGKFIFQAHVVTETAAALDINRKGKEIVCFFTQHLLFVRPCYLLCLHHCWSS